MEPEPNHTTVRRQGTGRRAGLDRDAVVERALALVEAGGPEALTMRKLAADLGVTTTSIYWHVGGRDELVLALVERLGQRLAAAEVQGRTPRERILSATRLVWESALRHPEVTGLAHQVGATSLLNHRLELVLARELDAAGVRGERARDALRGILACVGGFLVLALRRTDRVPSARTSQALWAAVDDPGIDPSTVAAMAGPVDLGHLFETTMAALVDSIVPE